MYHRAVLSNGIKVICETMPHVASVTLGIWIGTGSRHEEARYSGISHLLEHMSFKGTTTRSAKDIAEQIDAVGGQLNAFTSKEYTCYYVKVLNQHFCLGVDLLADMVTHSALQETELEKEKSVVLEEIKSYEDAPGELIHDLFVSLVFQDHPLGQSILGTPASVTGLNRTILQSYLKQHYTPDNIVFAVAGNVQFDQVLSEIAGRLDALQGSSSHQTAEMPSFKPENIYKNKDIEQVHLCIGGRGVSRSDPRKFATIMLDNILGGSLSSRLFQRLREDEGLVYDTGSSHSAFSDGGIFSIYAATSKNNYQRVAKLIHEELTKLQEELVPEQELRRVKEQLKGNLYLGLERSSSRMSRLAKVELFKDKLLTPEELVTLMEAVTAQEVREIAQELLAEDKLMMTAIGAFGEVS